MTAPSSPSRAAQHLPNTDRRIAPQTAPAAAPVLADTQWDRWRHRILQLGLLRTILLETALAELGLLALAALLTWLFDGDSMLPAMAIVTVCVCVTAPSIGYVLFKLLLELESAHQRGLELAATDALTGIFNRCHFMLAADREVEHAKRFETPLSIIMLDIDHFKRINDSHGHHCGDEVLRQIAQTCKGMLRGTDVLARFGGEEMVFLLPQTNLAGAAILAERVRARIASLVIEWHGEEIRPTASLGAAALPFEMTSVDALIHCADTALYDAKRLGRDQVFCAPEPPASAPAPASGEARPPAVVSSIAARAGTPSLV